jgi:hypothetical protein
MGYAEVMAIICAHAGIFGNGKDFAVKIIIHKGEEGQEFEERHL